MIGSYPHRSLWVNGRFVSLDQIVSGEQTGKTAFEENTFSFIKEWFSGKNEFQITTSGSTGTPKKIFTTRSQMISSARLTIEALGLKPSESCLVCIDTKFIGGRMMLVRAFTLGLQIFAVDPCANPIEKLPAGQCVNFAAFVPYQVETILGSGQTDLMDRVSKAIIGGAPLRDFTAEELSGVRCLCWATYGMTETISHVALHSLNGEAKRDYFVMLPGISGELDERNCLILKVPYLPSPVITNDIVELISPSRFRWLGRFDNVINTGGIKVNPEKIESAIASFFEQSGHRSRFFVHGISDSLLGSRVVLVIEANTIGEEFLRSLYSFLKARLSEYEIPKGALLVSKFSETENGKINRLQTVKGFHANVSLK